MRFQLELFGMCWVLVSEVSPILEEEDQERHEVLSSIGFGPNEDEED